MLGANRAVMSDGITGVGLGKGTTIESAPSLSKRTSAWEGFWSAGDAEAERESAVSLIITCGGAVRGSTPFGASIWIRAGPAFWATYNMVPFDRRWTGRRHANSEPFIARLKRRPAHSADD